MGNSSTIDKLMFFEICEELHTKGIRPTVEKLRNAIGRGSNTTISKLLREYWKAKESCITSSLETYKISKAVDSHISRLIAAVIDEANVPIKETKEEIKKIFEQIHASMEDLEQTNFEIDKIQVKVKDLKVEKAELLDQNIKLEKQIKKIDFHENAYLKGQIETLQKENSVIKDEIKELRVENKSLLERAVKAETKSK